MAMLNFDLIEQLLRVGSEQQWAEQLFAISWRLGFDNLLFGYLPQKHMSISAAQVITNFPSAWRQFYRDQHLIEVDPSIIHCTQHQQPWWWQAQNFQLPAQKRMYEEACMHGLRYGVCLPVHGMQQDRGMFIFTSPLAERHPQHLPLSDLAQLSLLRDFAVDALRPYLNQSNHPAISLTPRETECLKWSANGKSSWEISRILSCSEATVNQHITNIKCKFGVSSRQQAIIKALQIGSIQLN